MTPKPPALEPLTQQALQSMLTYSLVTGEFFWKVQRNRNQYKRAGVGSVAGTVDAHGSITIRLGRKNYKAHRLAFLYLEGIMPPEGVDHVNGVRADNRWLNLRHCTASENGQNRKKGRSASGFTGVKKHGNRWVASIGSQCVTYYLGTFPTAQAAADARAVVKAGLHTFNPVERT